MKYATIRWMKVCSLWARSLPVCYQSLCKVCSQWLVESIIIVGPCLKYIFASKNFVDNFIDNEVDFGKDIGSNNYRLN